MTITFEELQASLAAAAEWNAKQLAENVLTTRHITELVLEYQEAHKLLVDGKAGTNQTIPSIERAMALRERAASTRPPFPARRCWPVRALADGRKPRVTSAFRKPSRPLHPGLDIFYRFDANLDPPMPIGDGGRDKNWINPPGTLAIAVADARVAMASWVRTGFRVWLDLVETDYFPGYFHLSELRVKPGDVVKMGDPLGVIGDNPIDHDPDHLHFELHHGSLDTYPRGLLDPELFLEGAQILPAAY